MNSPIFIFGSARSGTSLLSRIVGSHPDIGVPYESHLYNQFYPWLKHYGDLRERRNQARLVTDMLTTDVMNDWEPKPSFDKIMGQIRKDDFHGIVDAVMNAWLGQVGKKRWGEKTPWHLYYWREILQGFPDARFIYIVRDGRDSSLSWLRARFGPKHIYVAAQRWKHYLDHYKEFRRNVNSEQLLEIRYEDLLDDPEGIARRICDHVGEPFSQDMLAFHEQAVAYPTDKGNDANLAKPLMQSNKEKWRTHMSPIQLRIFEAVAGKELEECGYERAVENASVGTLEKFYITRLLHPSRRALSMLRNVKGQKDGLLRLWIYLRLRLRAATGSA